jgi:hypothetical protein
MRSIIIAVFLITNILNINSQVVVKGKVLNQQNDPINYVEILFLNSENEPVLSDFSDESGNFMINTAICGEYTFILRFMNKQLYIQKLTLSKERGIIDLGIIIVESSLELKEVVINQNRKLIDRKIDRIVYNIENSVVSQGMDLSEALSLTPMLKVDQDKISIIGRSGVGVMINGKMLNMNGENMMNYLRSLRSDDVSSIEIITTPPAKYEAQGNSGLINIILKRNTNIGWNGNISSSYVQRRWGGITNSASLNYQSDKINTSIKIRNNDGAYKTEENHKLIGKSSVLNSTFGKSFNNVIGVNASFEYKINKKSEFGFIYDFGHNHYNRNNNNEAIYQTDNIETDHQFTYAEHRERINAHMLNTYYGLRLDEKGKNFGLNFNYFNNKSNLRIDLNTIDKPITINEKDQNVSDVEYRILSGQTDLKLPYQWGIIETGLKFTHFDNISDVKYLDLIDEEYQIDPSKSNIFDYDENNYATYLSLFRQLHEKWTIKLGLRYEYSYIKGYSPSADDAVKFHYGKWFPSAYLMYDNALSLSYSKRINRPEFSTLNPFRKYVNPNTYFTGNPMLQPSYNHNIEIGYTFKDLSANIYWQRIVDGYASYQYLDNGTQITTYGNYFNQTNWGLNLSYSGSIKKWWKSSVSINPAYAKPDIKQINAIAQSGFAFFYNVNNTFTLNSSETLYSLMYYNQGLPLRQTNFYSKGMANLSLGLRAFFLHKNMQVSIVATDIFKQQRARGEVYFSDNTQYYNNYFDSRRLQLSINYTWGNTNGKKQKRIEFEDRSRAY